ncbi:hypothetical protein R1flu_021836 [Riccia fluitans]|uniref:Uncharacterized protein n=1 Tax=Riccia fluitans TaxID=41844 RepID=A0ABD1ZQJ1_9MARC
MQTYKANSQFEQRKFEYNLEALFPIRIVQEIYGIRPELCTSEMSDFFLRKEKLEVLLSRRLLGNVGPLTSSQLCRGNFEGSQANLPSYQRRELQREEAMYCATNLLAVDLISQRRESQLTPSMRALTSCLRAIKKKKKKKPTHEVEEVSPRWWEELHIEQLNTGEDILQQDRAFLATYHQRKLGLLEEMLDSSESRVGQPAGKGRYCFRHWPQCCRNTKRVQ